MKQDREETLRRLASVGCSPGSFSGDRTFRCPACSDGRKPGNRRKKCLSVKSDSVGFQFYCHHCEDMRGGFYNHSGEPIKRRRPPPIVIRKPSRNPYI